MHSYINYSKLASLYVCFSMLHTTLHNETDIIQRNYRNHHIGHTSNASSDVKENEFYEEENATASRQNDEGERKIFDMIIPKYNQDLLLWPKTGKYVVIPYALDTSLSPDQRRAIPSVLRSIENHTCVRFADQHRPCGGGGAKLCFRSGPQRAAHWGRRPGGPQPVTLAPGDGPYWVLHLVGHVLGLPHPHTCLQGQERSRNVARTSCIPRLCPWRRYDSSSALRLAPEELSGWQSPHLGSAAALLALWRTRRAARFSHWDRRALRDLYRCWEGHPRCPARRCRHGGFVDGRCRCVCPTGFGGEDCGVRTGRGGEGCVRHVTVGAELELVPSGLVEMGTAAIVDQCTLRVRTSSQRLRVLVTIAGAVGQSAMIYSEALFCAVKMFVFQDGIPRMFCLLDYLGEPLVLEVVNNTVDFLFSSDSALANTHTVWGRTRLVIRSADSQPANTTGNAATLTTRPITTAPPATAASAAPTGKDQTRAAGGTMPSLDLIILPPILFALMGVNVLVVFCIKKYWEYRYGTAGIYRGTEGDQWADQDEEEPEDWQVRVEYSESFAGAGPLVRETVRDASLPQADLTDLELFRIMYGIPGHASPDGTAEEGRAESANGESVPSEERQDSTGSLTPKGTSPKTKKRVSFSDESGMPLHVHSDAPAGKQKQKHERESKRRTANSTRKLSQPKPGTDEVRIIVPFADTTQSAQSADHDNGSDSDEGSEESSCCDSSSSSSYHEDDDDPKKAEPGLFHGLTRCFRRRQNESNEI